MARRPPSDTSWHASLPDGKKFKGYGSTSVICCIDGVCYAPGAQFHGTAGGYVNHRCRCDQCRAVWSEYHQKSGAQQRWRARNVAAGLTADGHPRRRKPNAKKTAEVADQRVLDRPAAESGHDNT